MFMAAVMVVLSATLVPVWGVLGAAVAAAITNAGINLLNLLEVRKVLGLSPYNRGYWRLLPPTLATLTLTLVLRSYSYIFHHDWLAVGITLALAYCVFAVMVPLAGLDADDRLIAAAMWSRIRGSFAKAAGVEA